MEYSNNQSVNETQLDHENILCQIVATTLQVAILITGLIGNMGLIFVVYKRPSLHTPTYAYLTSLAAADILVLITAIPESLIFHFMGTQWVAGAAGCSLFGFLHFFTINVGSMSLAAFTVERYIAVCRPYIARQIFSKKRARQIIMVGWMVTFLYCSPWFGLTVIRSDTVYPEVWQCVLRDIPQEVYTALFLVDLLLFYVAPLLIAAVVYICITQVLGRHAHEFRWSVAYGTSTTSRRSGIMSNANGYVTENSQSGSAEMDRMDIQTRSFSVSSQNHQRRNISIRSTERLSTRMLIFIVLSFALLWLPFRGLLVYNTLAEEPWLDIWYLLFAKTLVYLNCALNPFLYNVSSSRFRKAVRKTVRGQPSFNFDECSVVYNEGDVML